MNERRHSVHITASSDMNNTEVTDYKTGDSGCVSSKSSHPSLIQNVAKLSWRLVALITLGMIITMYVV